MFFLFFYQQKGVDKLICESLFLVFILFLYLSGKNIYSYVIYQMFCL